MIKHIIDRFKIIDHFLDTDISTLFLNPIDAYNFLKFLVDDLADLKEHIIGNEKYEEIIQLELKQLTVNAKLIMI